MQEEIVLLEDTDIITISVTKKSCFVRVRNKITIETSKESLDFLYEKIKHELTKYSKQVNKEKPGDPWTAQEIRKLEELLKEGFSMETIGRILNKPARQIESKRTILGYRRPIHTTWQPPEN